MRFGNTISIFFFIIQGLALLSFTGCNLPVGDMVGTEPAQPTLVSIKTPGFEIGSTDTLHDGTKIVIMSLETDIDSKLTDVVFLIPDELIGAEISANDNPLADVAWQENQVELLLGDDVAAEAMVFTFEKGNRLAFCSIKTDSLTMPQGDCGW